MPDEWEKENGLDPNNADDRNKYNLDSRRYYTNLEVYCNSLVEDLVKAQNAEAVTDMESAFEEYYPDYQNGEAVAAAVMYAHPDGSTNANTQTWDDGAKLTITGNSGKTLDPTTPITYKELTTYGKSIKLSNGAQNTFYCPEGKVATGVTFISYVNKNPIARTSYWKEVAGVNYDESTATLMKSALDAENPDVISFSLPNLSQFTFTNTGEQPCFMLEVTMTDATSVKGVQTVGGAAVTTNVYSINGRLLIKNATDADINALGSGVYVVGNRKIMVR